MSQDDGTQRNRPGKLESMPAPPKFEAVSEYSEDEELVAWQAYASGPSTPSFSEAAQNLKHSLSITGIQDFASRPSAEVRRSIQNKLWRPKDEESLIPSDWERLLLHVVRAGARAFALSYGIRSLLFFLLEIIKAVRARRLDRGALRAAFIGERTSRFAFMFALWASLYKFVRHALRLLTPFPKSKSPAVKRMLESSVASKKFALTDRYDTISPSSRSLSDDALTVTRDKERRRNVFKWDPRAKVWHAYAAGAVSSLALLVGDRSLLKALYLQLFVRGCQGTYNMLHNAGYINIPHASVLTFGLANMQIMSSWLSHREHLSPAYRAWIDKAAGIPVHSVLVYDGVASGRGPDPWLLSEMLDGGNLPEPISTDPLTFPSLPPTRHNFFGMESDVVRGLHRWLHEGNPDSFYCAIAHPHTTSHLRLTIENLWKSWSWIMPVYLTLYFVPAVFFRSGRLVKAPGTTISRTFLSASRSSAFLAAYICLVKSGVCILQSLHDTIYYSPRLNKSRTLMALSRVFASDYTKLLPAFATALTLFVENPRRRSELAAYVTPKALESFWKMGRDKGFLPLVPYGDFLLAASGLSMIMGSYAQNPECLTSLVSQIIYQFLGRN